MSYCGSGALFCGLLAKLRRRLGLLCTVVVVCHEITFSKTGTMFSVAQMTLAEIILYLCCYYATLGFLSCEININPIY